MGRHVESGAALPQLQCARGDGVLVRCGEAAELDVRNPSGTKTPPFFFRSDARIYIYTAVSAPAIFFTVKVSATKRLP